MQKTIDETNRRREKQMAYNQTHGIVPTTIRKSMQEVFAQTSVLDIKGYDPADPAALLAETDTRPLVLEEQTDYKTVPQLEKTIKTVRKAMEKASRELDFMEAARLRDEMFRLEGVLKEMKA